MLYDLVDKYLMNDFTADIANHINQKEDCVIFDVGCFQGNFSKSLSKKIKKAQFYLFDANSNITNNNFKFYPYAVYDEETTKNYYLNTFFPASGSSIDCETKNDWLWNLTRKIITLKIFAKYEMKTVKTITLDNFTKENSIDHIDVLKIDVEGSEFNVLKGAKNILEKTKIIFIEINSTKKNFDNKYNLIKSFLEKYNFKLNKQKNILSYSILSKQKAVDALFIKN